jgi:16S rRNA (cytosine1402-N4)-methyltransferase
MMDKSYHIPVLYKEVAELLITDFEGIYIDGTLGGGGHAEYLLQLLSTRAKYLALDLDWEAIDFAQKRLKQYKNISFFQSNFRDTEKILAEAKVTSVDGILLDLGVSSHQIDEPDRGFSYMADGEIDMRMNNNENESARDLLNHSRVDELSDIFYKFGEERNARRIARLIVEERKEHPFVSTGQVRTIIDKVSHPRFVIKSYARVFQALRIAVNHELENLHQALNASLKIVKSGGRVAVIAYHSLEDRMVKNFFREKADPCVCPPDFPKCMCGLQPQMKIITRKPVKPSENEIRENSRARSALLRVGEII